MSPSPEQLLTDASREQPRPAVDATFTAYDDHPLDEPDEWGDLASWRAAAGSS